MRFARFLGLNNENVENWRGFGDIGDEGLEYIG